MNFSANWEYPVIKTGEPVLNHLMLRLEAPPDSGNGERTPAIIALALDRSWSMMGEKLDATMNAASYFINWLTRHDFAAVIAYAENVQIIQPLTKLTEKSSIVNRIKTMQPGTATNLSGGWLQALKSVESEILPNATRQVILLTDGNATTGIMEPEQLVEIAKQYRAKGIRTTTIGFGQDFNEQTLQQIAAAGGGNFYFIDNPEKAADVFYKEFGSLSPMQAQAVELSLELPAGFVFREMISEEPYTQHDNILTLHPGDMRADEQKTIVMAFEVNSKNQPELQIPVKMSWYKTTGKMGEEEQYRNVVLKTGNEQSKRDRSVELEMLVAWVGKTVMEVSRMAETDLNGALSLLESMINRLRESLNLAIEVLDPLVQRLEGMQQKLREDSVMARKHLMAQGMQLSFMRNDPLVGDEVKYHDEIYELKPDTEMDMYNAPDLKQRVTRLMKQGYRYVIMDLSSTSYVDSSALGAMIQISSWLTRRGGKLVLANVSGPLEKVFEITRLNAYLPMSESITGENSAQIWDGYSKHGGWEMMDPPLSLLEKMSADGRKILGAPRLKPGNYDCIFSPSLAGMLAHEAFGHGTEGDTIVKHRAKGSEYMGKRVASEIVCLYDSPALESQAASYFFDHEGQTASLTKIVENGILNQPMTDHRSAIALKAERTPNGRREAYDHKIYTRMTNTFFEAGNDKLPDMIASVKEGYLVDRATNGMEDPKEWGIQLEALYAEKILNGKLTGEVFSPVIITGYVPDILSSISHVSDKVEINGLGMCGKGYKEWVKVTDGGPWLKLRARLA